jgi:hypothetical protein
MFNVSLSVSHKQNYIFFLKNCCLPLFSKSLKIQYVVQYFTDFLK